MLESSAETEIFDYGKILKTVIPSITCPEPVYEVVMSDGSPIDPKVFTFNAAAGTLNTESSDPTKVGNY